jgi:hypothetical protein
MTYESNGGPDNTFLHLPIFTLIKNHPYLCKLYERVK